MEWFVIFSYIEQHPYFSGTVCFLMVYYIEICMYERLSIPWALKIKRWRHCKYIITGLNFILFGLVNRVSHLPNSFIFSHIGFVIYQVSVTNMMMLMLLFSMKLVFIQHNITSITMGLEQWGKRSNNNSTIKVLW